MIAVWTVKRKGSDGKNHYSLRWQVPVLDATGEPVRGKATKRHPLGRPLYRTFSESAKATDNRSAETARKKKHAEVNGLIAKGEPEKHISFSDLAELNTEWLKNLERAEGTVYLSNLSLTHFTNFLTARGHSLNADEVTPADIDGFMTWRRATVKPKAVKNDLGALRATFNRAVKRGLLKANPFTAVEMPTIDPRAITPLTPDEEAKIIGACGTDLEIEAFVRLALDTGCRAGELCNIMVSNLDLDSGLGRIECNTEWRSKTRRNRAIAFTPETAAKVRLWLNTRPFAKHVFRNPEDNSRATYKRIARRFEGAVKTAEIGRNVTLQDCRRTVGTLLAARGINQRVAAEFLGHSNIATTARYYQTVGQDTLKGVVGKLRPKESAAS